MNNVNEFFVVMAFVVLSAFTHIGNAQTVPPDSTAIHALEGVWVLDSMSCSLNGQKTEPLFNAMDSLKQIAFRLEEQEMEAVWGMESFQMKDRVVSKTVTGYLLTENTLELIPGAGIVYYYGWILHASGVLELQRTVAIVREQQQLFEKHNFYYTKQ